MDEASAKAVRDALSPERLAPYEEACARDLGKALRLYGWNIEVSAAFYGPLSCLEVLLRNAIHRELATLFVRYDWWSAPGVNLHRQAQLEVERAQDKIHQNRRRKTHDRMVAELPLGFWVSLLGQGNDYEMRLWRPALHRAFPGYRGRRKPLHDALDHVRFFRNRIAHYEPIHHRHLEADHGKIIQLIGYVSPEAVECVRSFDRVPDVLARKMHVCDNAAKVRF